MKIHLFKKNQKKLKKIFLKKYMKLSVNLLASAAREIHLISKNSWHKNFEMVSKTPRKNNQKEWNKDH